MRSRSRKGLLAAVLGWSLLGTPVALFLGGAGKAWGAVPMFFGLTSACVAFCIPGCWDDYPHKVLRERLTAAPVLTAAVLLVPSPWLVPWVAHDWVGEPVRAMVTERTALSDTSWEADDGRFVYRVADATTERDLGRLLYGLPEPVPVGTVVEVSVVPGGWIPAVSAERLEDGGARPYVTAFGALAALHLLGCAGAWVAWPREPW
ncbi:hypothetical protein [Streptomyces sp. NPDC051016]|uniref:hypothetical protein n=1 Tax=Streptomyces sp. NPDC051016 TaxID=3365638 RepID=UPI0037B0931C